MYAGVTGSKVTISFSAARRVYRLAVDERWFRDLVDSAPDGVIAVDPEGRIVYANSQADSMFGYSAGAMLGLEVEDLLPHHMRSDHTRRRSTYASEPRKRAMGSGLDIVGRRSDGVLIPLDISLSPMSGRGSEVFVTAFVRDVSEARRTAARMEAVAELTQALLRGRPPAQVLQLVADRARSLLDAAHCWVLGDVDGSEARVIAGSGYFEKRRARGEHGDEPALGPALHAPLKVEGRVIAMLAVARSWGAPEFSEPDAEVLGRFADQAALALHYGELRGDIEALRLAADRERIARDLHDTVIQRLFATGMGLQAALSLVQAPEVRERVERAVDDLDGVVRGIRSTIFELQATAASTLRRQVLELVGEYSRVLGFAPTVRFEGAVDSSVPEEVRFEMMPTLREALANVARHAGASAAEVTVTVDEMVVLEVADDGKGPHGTRTARRSGVDRGHGLANMADRAARMGGYCALRARPGGGSLLHWEVPLGRSALSTPRP